MGLLNRDAFIIDMLNTVGVNVYTSGWALDGMFDKAFVSELY